MKIKDKKLIINALLILTLAFGVIIPAMNHVAAQEEDVSVGIMLIYARPVIGVNQIWLYGIQVDPSSRWESYYGVLPGGYAWPTAYTLFTAPDGTVTKVNGPFQVDAYGVRLGANFTFNKLGTWTVKLVWPGDRYFKAANTSVTITVQQNPIPKRNVDTYMSLRPFPRIGIGQSLLVSAWVTPVNEFGALNYKGYLFTFTKPDGTTMTIGPMNAELSGTVWFEYAVTQIGNWSLKFEFPGDDYDNPTSTTTVFIVQQEPINGYPDGPLPEDQWSFPISVYNRNWRDIAGPWYQSMYGNDESSFNPYTQAPRTAHILWRLEPPNSSLIAGFGYGGYRGSPDSIRTPEGTFSAHYPNIKTVMSGIGYYTEAGQRANKIYAINMTTGKEIWETDGTFTQGAVRVNRPVLYEFATGHMRIYEGYSGQLFNDIPIPADLTFRFLEQHSINMLTGAITQDQAVYSTQNWVEYSGQGGRGTQQLNVLIRGVQAQIKAIDDWQAQGLPLSDTQIKLRQEYNATLTYYNAILKAGGTIEPRLIKWNAAGSSFNFTTRIIWNITLPVDIFSPYSHTLLYNDILFTRNFYPQTGIVYNIVAWNATSGAMLYNKSVADPTNPDTWVYREGPAIGVGRTNPDANGRTSVRIFFAAVPERKVPYTDVLGTTYNVAGRGYYAYDLYTGDKVWTSEATDYPWGDFWAYTPQANGYGNIYALGYAGVYAINLTDGKVNWHYSAGNSGMETPYNTWVYGSTGPVVGGGIVFAPNTEHSPTFYYRGEKLHAIDAFTGQRVWTIMGNYQPTALTYGILVASDRPNGVTYGFAKGPTATTVSVSSQVIQKGSSILIQGSVLDQSTAQYGSAAVSDESQEGWMEYLHMQQPKPANATGVPVTLEAVNANGNTINIGTVTTDTTGMYSLLWQPTNEGTFTVKASFKGSEAYYSSQAETAIGVTQAPTPNAALSPTANPTQAISPSPAVPPGAGESPLVGMYVVAAVVIVAAVIITAALLRRRR